MTMKFQLNSKSKLNYSNQKMKRQLGQVTQVPLMVLIKFATSILPSWVSTAISFYSFHAAGWCLLTFLLIAASGTQEPLEYVIKAAFHWICKRLNRKHPKARDMLVQIQEKPLEYTETSVQNLCYYQYFDPQLLLPAKQLAIPKQQCFLFLVFENFEDCKKVVQLVAYILLHAVQVQRVPDISESIAAR